ncbi:MAG: M23 family metallopeptidase [Candidatus Pacearchaeota archaeon]
MKIKNIKSIEKFFYENPESLKIIKGIEEKDLIKKIIEKIEENKIKNLDDIINEIENYNNKKNILNFFSFYLKFLFSFYILISNPKSFYDPKIKIEEKLSNIESKNKIVKKIEFENYCDYLIVTSKFGEKRIYGGTSKGKHLGIDLIPTKIEDRYIKAFMDGKVFYKGKGKEYGNFVITEHNLDSVFLYSLHAHCGKIYVNKDDTIKKGEKIAYMWKSGKARGIHMHWEIRKSKNKINNIEEYKKLNPIDPLKVIEKLKNNF